VKKQLLFVFIFIRIGSVQSQIAQLFFDEFTDSSKTKMGVIADYGFNSNALTSQFVSRFYNNGYIDPELKKDILNRVRQSNRIGGDINSGIFITIKPDSLFHKSSYMWFVNLKERAHFDSRFSDDLYKVAFYGNSAFAGKTALLSEFSLNYLHYQQLQIGLYSTKYDSAAHWGIGVSILKGQNYLNINAPKAELFTSQTGEYVDFNTSMQVVRSNPAQKGIAAFNGWGASVDIYFEAPFKTRLGASKLKVSASDIGVIRFDKNTDYLKHDSLFHYNGFTINNINDLQDSTFGGTTQDSLVRTYVPFKKQAFVATLPAVLQLSFETHFSKNFFLTEGIRYVFNANYHLLFYIKGSCYIHPKVLLSATFAYGGYGNYNYGLGLFAKFGKGFYASFGSNNIEGFIVPTKTFGQGAYISIVKSF
jgi:Family of unknown function (DUF5723)